jgi:Transposase IS116/IS110/IS902 family
MHRVTGISKIGNAVLRAALFMPAMSAMRYNPAIVRRGGTFHGNYRFEKAANQGERAEDEGMVVRLG